MSKSKTRHVFRVSYYRDQSVYVLARHAKGAISIAASYGYDVEKRNGKPCVWPAPLISTDRCINLKSVEGDSSIELLKEGE